MSLLIEQPQPVPLSADKDGVVRVGGTRVTLDTVLAAFQNGATAEEIVQQYPSLSLADIYSVLGYILRHRDEVATYLHERHNNQASIRQQNEKLTGAQGIRARLLARKSGRVSEGE